MEIEGKDISDDRGSKCVEGKSITGNNNYNNIGHYHFLSLITHQTELLVSALKALSHLILTIIQKARVYFHSNFIEKENKA